MTRCPSRTNRRAIAWPNPAVAPVTRTVIAIVRSKPACGELGSALSPAVEALPRPGSGRTDAPWRPRPSPGRPARARLPGSTQPRAAPPARIWSMKLSPPQHGEARPSVARSSGADCGERVQQLVCAVHSAIEIPQQTNGAPSARRCASQPCSGGICCRNVAQTCPLLARRWSKHPDFRCTASSRSRAPARIRVMSAPLRSRKRRVRLHVERRQVGVLLHLDPAPDGKADPLHHPVAVSGRLRSGPAGTPRRPPPARPPPGKPPRLR